MKPRPKPPPTGMRTAAPTDVRTDGIFESEARYIPEADGSVGAAAEEVTAICSQDLDGITVSLEHMREWGDAVSRYNLPDRVPRAVDGLRK